MKNIKETCNVVSQESSFCDNSAMLNSWIPRFCKNPAMLNFGNHRIYQRWQCRISETCSFVNTSTVESKKSVHLTIAVMISHFSLTAQSSSWEIVTALRNSYDVILNNIKNHLWLPSFAFPQLCRNFSARILVFPYLMLYTVNVLAYVTSQAWMLFWVTRRP